MRNWKQYTLETLKKYNIRASKSEGQNFLTRYRVVSNIIMAAEISDEKVLEIGGGVGILTHALSLTDADITVIEKNDKLAEHLQKEYPDTKIIVGDALRTDWPENSKIVANLPYSVSVPIIKQILHGPTSEAVIMVQKEVAQRCMASPGDKKYGRLSILCQIHGEVSHVMDVDPDAFFPKPKVTSTVIRIKVKAKTFNNSHDDIELLAKNLLIMRRRITRSVVRGYAKRKTEDDGVWDQCPHKNKRTSDLSAKMMDDIVSHLKKHKVWPLA